MAENQNNTNKILIEGFVVGPIQTNVWYLHREGSRQALLIDPADHGDKLYEALSGQGLEIETILLTHAHFDHIGGLQKLRELSGAKVFINEKEARLCSDTDANLSSDWNRPLTVEPDRWLWDGETIETCGIRLRMIATPGHTEGSCCYYIEGHDTDGKLLGNSEEPILIAGDTLFEESVGRTDMATGSASAIVRSVREKLFLLPDDTMVYPGHGGTTTIGHEKLFNAFV